MEKKGNHDRAATRLSDETGLSYEVAKGTLIGYRSAGVGIFGVAMRWAGMPLEKIALFMNSSQVSGSNQFAQSVRLTFQGGMLAPYRVVGPNSIAAWFMQYSVMGMAFQVVDSALSDAMGVRPVCYGDELMEPPSSPPSPHDGDASFSAGDSARVAFKNILAPLLAGALESTVANRAEVERYFGPKQFANIESKLAWPAPSRMLGPAFVSNATRNVVMCSTTFLLTPITYKQYFPQEKKNAQSLFWFGLGMNVFVGNVVAITQQALWGRSLDYCAQNGGRNIRYADVVRLGLRTEGMSAFFTVPKWSSRVLMNAPAQGALPWFYNDVLPIGEEAVLNTAKMVLNVRKSGPFKATAGAGVQAVSPRQS
jgi:hypothetical protein